MAMSRSALAERAGRDIRAVAARRARAEMGAASTRPARSGRPPVAAARAACASGTLAATWKCPCGWSSKYLCEASCAEQRRRDEHSMPHLPHKSPAINLYGQLFRRTVNRITYVDLHAHHSILALRLPPLLLSWKYGLCLIGVGCQAFSKSLLQYMR